MGDFLAEFGAEGVLIHIAADIGEGVAGADDAVVVALREEEGAKRGRGRAFGRTRRNGNGGRGG